MLTYIGALLLLCGSCEKPISADSVVISMENTDKWKFDEKNGYYKYEAKAPDSLMEFERRPILVFTPDTTFIKKQVNYKTIKRQLIPIDSLRKGQVENHLLYLYKQNDDNKSGVLIKIKKIDSLVLIRFPKTVYD